MNSNLWRRLAALLATAGLAGSLLATVAAPTVLAVAGEANCDTGNPAAWQAAVSSVGEECVLAGAVSVTGTITVTQTLHILNTGSINASLAGAPGITLNISNAGGAAADTLGGTGQLIMDAGASVIDTNDFGGGAGQPGGPITVTATGGGQLAAGSTIKSDNDADNANGGNITLTFGATSSLGGTISSRHTSTASGDGGNIRIFVTGNLTMPPSGLITSSKTGDSNEAGDIRISVSGDMLMQGTGTVDTSARIFARHLPATNGTPGGNIRIDVGTGDLGTFTMETGTRVDSGGQGFAGNIWIKAGDKVNVNEGAAVLAGQFAEQDTRGHGGRIFVIAGCEANIFGTLSSQGHDPGADLVHVEGCLVHVGPHGLVESTAPAHQPSTPASCDNINDPATSRGGEQFDPNDPLDDFNRPGEVLRDHPETSSVCVEIWARHVTIDEGGEVNANYAQGGGPEGHGWVDIFAEQDITIKGPAIGTAGTSNIPVDFEYLKFAVHSNSFRGNDTGGDVTVKAQGSFVSLTGQALQADSTANGGTGGHVIVQARGDVLLDGSIVEAKGAPGGGAPSGGIIEARSFQGVLTGAAPGKLDASGDGAAHPGLITLQSCLGTNYTGASTPAAQILGDDCTVLAPTIPVITDANGGPVFKTDRWNRCGVSSISGIKFLDSNANNAKDVGEPGLPGWDIHIFSGAFHQVQTTGPGGVYSFTGLAAGTYTVCEELIVAVPPWIQTFPTSGVDCTLAADPALDNATPGQWGYSVTVGNGGVCCSGTTVVDKDFGNIQKAIKTGIKWLDANADHTRDLPEDVALDGWDIHLYGTAVNGSAVHEVSTTAGGGIYTFTVLPGTYTVCEEMPILVPPWIQTFPTAGANCITPADPAGDNGNPGPLGYAIVLTPGLIDDGNDFGNHRETFTPPDKTGQKWNDLNGDGIHQASEPGLPGWPINLYGPGPVFPAVPFASTVTDANGNYTFSIPSPGPWRVCEGPAPASLPGNWSQTFPNSGTPSPNAQGETIDDFCPPPNVWGYEFTATSGVNLTGNDFGNHKRVVECPEDPGRAAALTRIVVSQSKFTGAGSGVAGDPKEYLTVQAAYDAAKASAQSETIGLFANTTENLLLDGSKNLTITQCTVARVTGVAGVASPVWNITSTGKLTIVGPDSVGGSIGWRVAGNGGHTLKSIRANGATIDGVLIVSNGNSLGWNDISGNGNGTATAAGIRVEGSTNTLKGGSVLSNNGDGVQLVIADALHLGASNSLSGAKIQSNARNGVFVTGQLNTVSDNKNTINNGQAGFNFAAFPATKGTKVKGNEASSNTGNEFTIGANNVNQGGNKKNGVAFTFGLAGGDFN